MRTLTLERILGRGAMGTTYAATIAEADGSTSSCAVKVMKGAGGDRQGLRERLAAQGRVLAAASVSGVLGVEEVLEVEGWDAVATTLIEGIDLGAIVSSEHLEKIESYVRLAVEEGGKIACGGSRPEGLPERFRGGSFFEPTVILGLPQDCRTNQEEIFGPVVSVQGFDTHAEAVTKANDVPYGLACCIYTRDLSRAHRMAARIDAGIIWVNCWMVRDLRTPFGGWKASGVGREGGSDALRFFTEPSNVCLALE